MPSWAVWKHGRLVLSSPSPPAFFSIHDALMPRAVLCHGFILKQAERGPAHPPLPMCIHDMRPIAVRACLAVTALVAAWTVSLPTHTALFLSLDSLKLMLHCNLMSPHVPSLLGCPAKLFRGDGMLHREMCG